MALFVPEISSLSDQTERLGSEPEASHLPDVALSVALIRDAAARNLTIAVAESLTGGLLCDAIVSVAGASRVFRGGIIAYSNDVKTEALGVSTQMLKRDGAVSQSTAVQMALGVATRLNTNIGLATTGVAGPEPQEGKPVGEVYVAAIRVGEQTLAQRLLLPGSRDEIRRASVVHCLDLAMRLL